jgi:hypothetical protein
VGDGSVHYRLVLPPSNNQVILESEPASGPYLEEVSNLVSAVVR